MNAFTDNIIVLTLSAIGILVWIGVLITAAIEILAEEPNSIITAGKLSLYVAFTASILPGIYVFYFDRKSCHTAVQCSQLN